MSNTVLCTYICTGTLKHTTKVKGIRGYCMMNRMGSGWFFLIKMLLLETEIDNRLLYQQSKHKKLARPKIVHNVSKFAELDGISIKVPVPQTVFMLFLLIPSHCCCSIYYHCVSLPTQEKILNYIPVSLSTRYTHCTHKSS